MVKGNAFKLNAVTPKTPEQTHYFRPFGSLRSSARTQVVALTVLNRVFCKGELIQSLSEDLSATNFSVDSSPEGY